MRIRGLDFTASSGTGKRNHLVEALLTGTALSLQSAHTLQREDGLEAALGEPGPWVMGVDFPFGLPRAFVDNTGWGSNWSAYGGRAVSLPIAEFRAIIESFRGRRPEGQKQPKRHVDLLAGAQSPLTTVRTPVAFMFHAGVRALLGGAFDVQPFRSTGAEAVVVEAYPALVVRRLIGGNRYKDADLPSRAGAREARQTILRRIERGDLSGEFGFSVTLAPELVEACIRDDHGDVLDSALCAVQAAWAYCQRDRSWGIPAGADVEGWICDPSLVRFGTLGPESVSEPPRLSGGTGTFNSSLTRVRPVFRALLDRDPSGMSWVPQLLRVGGPGNALATRLASECTQLVDWSFERGFAPSPELLQWCLEHPERLAKPREGSAVARAVRGHRADLLSVEGARVASAQQLGRQELARKGADGSSRQWWAFEGFTAVDCTLETESFVLLIEGKRFEPVSSTVSWMPKRNQVARNLEVAAAYARASHKEFAVLLIGPDGTQLPTESELRAGWPHLSPEEQDFLLAHLVGATTWRDVCRVCDLDYDALPLTVADVPVEQR